MINEWRISRFKSIGGTEKLPFRGLTILAGPNSSGKSSVIQSILLTSQSLGSQVTDRQLVLNGELVKLGTFEDVHNQQASDRTIHFGFDVDLDPEQQSFAASTRPRLWPGGWFRSFTTEIGPMNVCGDITFAPPLEELPEGFSRPLQADVVSAVFKTSIRDRQAALFPDELVTSEPDVRIRRRSDIEVQALLGDASTSFQGPAGPQQVLRYEVQFSPRAAKSLHQRRLELPLPELAGELIAARLHHFLPSSILWRQRELARALQTALRRVGTGSNAEVLRTMELWATSTDPIRSALALAVRDAAAARGVPISKLLRELRGADADMDALRALISTVEDAVGERARSAMALVPGPLPEEQDTAFQGLHAFFNNVRYLGPLRDDPKPVYAMSGAVDPMDVGSKGQYTAAVLDINSGLTVEFRPPGGKAIVRSRLLDAVRLWLEHFGMAEGVQTIDEGKLGHRLLIRPTGIRSHVDLTNVGVGVSQVLPIVVMALVSQPGTVLLFEQPELHLHPAVQSQLADFFIAVVRSGRQCVVETHSEYLINRLRLRIAEAEAAEELQNLVIVHFVERNGAASEFRPVFINEYGAIPGWPAGFFDQGPDEAERILSAGRRKRVARRESSQ